MKRRRRAQVLSPQLRPRTAAEMGRAVTAKSTATAARTHRIRRRLHFMEIGGWTETWRNLAYLCSRGGPFGPRWRPIGASIG